MSVQEELRPVERRAPTHGVARLSTGLSSSCTLIGVLTFRAVLPEFSDHSVYPRGTSLRRFCGFSPFSCFVESISYAVSTSPTAPNPSHPTPTLRPLPPPPPHT